MKIEAITPAVGAEISDIDLNTIDDVGFAAVREALLSSGVVAIRDQRLEPEAQVAFARRFGEIDEYPFTKDNPHFTPHPSGLAGIVRLHHDADNPGYENEWHIDMTWRQEPPMGSVLAAVELPASGGGDTMFSSLQAVYESLDVETQSFLQTLSQDHDWLNAFGRRMSAEDLGRFRADLPMVTHPAVRTHPETGRKGLFVNRVFGIGLKGLGQYEAKGWLERLYGLVATPEFQCRINWAPGTVVMWDNRAVAHYAVNDYYPERRVMDRVTVAGDKPF